MPAQCHFLRVCRHGVVAALLIVSMWLTGCAITSGSSEPSWRSSSDAVQREDVEGLKVPRRLKDKIRRLYDHDPVERAWAAYQLAKLGRSAAPAVPYLAHLLGDAEPVLLSRYLGSGFHSSSATTPGEEAAKALARIGQPAVALLSDALGSEQADVRRLATRAMGQIGDIRSVDALIRMLSDPEPQVRAAAAIALAGYRHPLVAQKLMDAYASAQPKQRSHLVYAMGQINDIMVVPFLSEKLSGAAPETRAAIALALGKLRDARAIDVLVAATSDADEIVRANATYALSAFFTPGVIDTLVNLLADKQERVREAAAEALVILSGLHFGTDREKWLAWWTEQKKAIH